MSFDLDRYYTPLELAENLISEQCTNGIGLCVDTTCGSGNLLLAANNVLSGIKCVGLDRDKKAITALRKKQPEWVLSVADLMKEKSYSRTRAFLSTEQSDLLLLNPPFSHGRTKSVNVCYNGSEFKASVAMAHILRSFELFNPSEGALVIVPESVLYSETDLLARHALKAKYSIDLVEELDYKTFSGARVHSAAVRIRPSYSNSKTYPKEEPKLKNRIKTLLIRGGLPVYMYEISREQNVVGFVHSTHIKDMVMGTKYCLPNTEVVRAGRIYGHLILIPRVGVPIKDLVQAITIDKEVQLSDCVIALKFSSFSKAEDAAARIREKYLSFLSQYRGTGARYITLARLKSWLINNGFSI
jgi:hypothetical protein